MSVANQIGNSTLDAMLHLMCTGHEKWSQLKYFTSYYNLHVVCTIN